MPILDRECWCPRSRGSEEEEEEPAAPTPTLLADNEEEIDEFPPPDRPPALDPLALPDEVEDTTPPGKILTVRTHSGIEPARTSRLSSLHTLSVAHGILILLFDEE